MHILFVFLVLVMLMVPGTVLGLNIGFAPPTIDAGELLPGESKHVEFFIMADNENDMIVSLSTKKATRDFFNPNKGRFRYAWLAEESSEEDISEWVTLMDDSVLVPPEKELRYLESGGAAYANKKLGAIISVPDDAEPGYHAGFISPYPRTSSQAGGTGIGIITVVEMAYVVNVLGNAVRDADIIGINLRRDAPDYGTLQILVKNSGTVTLSALADYIRVFDDENNTVFERGSNEFKIRPGNIGSIETRLDTTGLEGEYHTEAHVGWLTGEDDVTGTIDIGEYVPPPPSVTGGAVAPLSVPVGFPLWILPLIIAVFGALIWWRIR